MNTFICESLLVMKLYIKHSIKWTIPNQTTTVHIQMFCKQKEKSTKATQSNKDMRQKPDSVLFYMIYVTCRVMNKNSNVIVQLNLGGHQRHS